MDVFYYDSPDSTQILDFGAMGYLEDRYVVPTAQYIATKAR